MSERNGKCAFIPDGYTRDGFIEETKFHPAVRFVYRPSTVTERTVVNGLIRIEHAKGTEWGLAQTESLAADFMVAHLVTWDISFEGTELELNSENTLQIEHHVFNRMYMIIMGESVSDEMKEQDGESVSDEMKEQDSVKNLQAV